MNNRAWKNCSHVNFIRRGEPSVSMPHAAIYE